MFNIEIPSDIKAKILKYKNLANVFQHEKHLFTIEDFDRLLDILFPETNYRPSQREIILQILDKMFIENLKYVCVDLSTGAGKSLIALQVGVISKIIFGEDSLFLTKTIALQNQYLEDFGGKKYELRTMKSASNFDCYNAEDKPVVRPLHDSCKYSKAIHTSCSYRRAQAAYLSSSLKSLNYAFFLTSLLKSGSCSYNTSGLLICDEAHLLSDSFLNSFELSLNFRNFIIDVDPEVVKKIAEEDHFDEFAAHTILQSNLSSTEDKLTYNMVRTVIRIAEAGYKHYKFKSEHYAAEQDKYEDEHTSFSIDPIQQEQALELLQKSDTWKNLEKQRKHYNALMNKYREIAKTLSEIKNAQDFEENWSKIHNPEIDPRTNKAKPETAGNFTVKPVFFNDSFKQRLFGMNKRVLLLSATAGRVKESLRIKDKESFTATAPYAFNLSNRRFNYKPNDLVSLNYKNTDTEFPNYVEKIREIADKHKNDNIIIHTVSYKNAQRIKELGKFGRRLFIPDSKEVRNIENLIRPGMIVASPSIIEGVNLGGGKGRVQIFIKMPFPYLGDQWVKDKCDKDLGWYEWETMQAIIQGSGRGIRGPEDISDIYMLDPAFKRVFEKTIRYVPRWFIDSIIDSSGELFK